MKYKFLTIALLFVFVACGERVIIDARKESDRPSPPETFPKEFMPNGNECTCKHPETGNDVLPIYFRHHYDYTTTVNLWKSESINGIGGDWVKLDTLPLEEGGERFLGCSTEAQDPGDIATCVVVNQWTTEDPHNQFVESDFVMFGGDERFTDPERMAIQAQDTGFICDELCDIEHEQCAARNLPDASFVKLQNMLSTVLLVSPENPVPVTDAAEQADVDATACEREEITIDENRLLNSSIDGSSCILSIDSGISVVEFNFPAQFSSLLETTEEGSVLDFTDSSERISLSHNVTDSIYNGNVDYIKRSSDEFLALMNNGGARFCLKLH